MLLNKGSSNNVIKNEQLINKLLYKEHEFIHEILSSNGTLKIMQLMDFVNQRNSAVDNDKALNEEELIIKISTIPKYDKSVKDKITLAFILKGENYLNQFKKSFMLYDFLYTELEDILKLADHNDQNKEKILSMVTTICKYQIHKLAEKAREMAPFKRIKLSEGENYNQFKIKLSLDLSILNSKIIPDRDLLGDENRIKELDILFKQSIKNSNADFTELEDTFNEELNKTDLFLEVADNASYNGTVLTCFQKDLNFLNNIKSDLEKISVDIHSLASILYSTIGIKKSFYATKRKEFDDFFRNMKQGIDQDVFSKVIKDFYNSKNTTTVANTTSSGENIIINAISNVLPKERSQKTSEASTTKKAKFYVVTVFDNEKVMYEKHTFESYPAAKEYASDVASHGLHPHISSEVREVEKPIRVTKKKYETIDGNVYEREVYEY